MGQETKEQLQAELPNDGFIPASLGSKHPHKWQAFLQGDQQLEKIVLLEAFGCDHELR